MPAVPRANASWDQQICRLKGLFPVLTKRLRNSVRRKRRLLSATIPSWFPIAPSEAGIALR